MHYDPTLQTAWVEAKDLNEEVETENMSGKKTSKSSEPKATEGKPVLAYLSEEGIRESLQNWQVE